MLADIAVIYALVQSLSLHSLSRAKAITLRMAGYSHREANDSYVRLRTEWRAGDAADKRDRFAEFLRSTCKQWKSNMPSTSLFLQFSLLTGVFSPPVNGYSRKLRRSHADELESMMPIKHEWMNSDLPSLPLEFDGQDDIYMALDDPRVGTVDSEGNVLVPVDENDRIMPGYEHLIRPVRIQENHDSERISSNEHASSPKGLDVTSSAMDSEGPTVDASDSDDIVYDEKESKALVSALPSTRDYVDSIENDVSQFAHSASARLQMNDVDETIKSKDENDRISIEEMPGLTAANLSEVENTKTESSKVQQLVIALELGDRKEEFIDSNSDEFEEGRGYYQGILHTGHMEEVAKQLPMDNNNIDDDEPVRSLKNMKKDDLKPDMRQEKLRRDSAPSPTAISICAFAIILFF